MAAENLKVGTGSRHKSAAIASASESSPRRLGWLGVFLVLDVVFFVAVLVAAWTIAPVLVVALFAVIAVGVVVVMWSLDSTKKTSPALLRFNSRVAGNTKGGEVPDSV